MDSESGVVQKKLSFSNGVSSLRVDQVSGGVESPPKVLVTADQEDDSSSSSKPTKEEQDEEEKDEQEPPVLHALSSEQLARRPSFKKILDDLSSADTNLKSPLSAAAVATLQAQQAVIQQAAVANQSIIPGLLQSMQQSLTNTSVTNSSTSSSDAPVAAPLSMLMPSQLQLQSALFNASSQSPLIGQAQLPASLLSSALLNANMAATLSASAPSTLSGGSVPITSVSAVAHSQLKSPVSQALDDQSKKREVRLMKNREAARECRRKKKEYVRCLENRVAVLESQNQALIGELRALKELYLPKTQD